MTGVAGGADLSPELRDKALTLLARWDKDNNYSLGMLLDDFDRLLRARRQGALPWLQEVYKHVKTGGI